MDTARNNVLLLGPQNWAALLRKLPTHLLLRSQILSLPHKEFMEFWMSPQAGDGSVAPERQSVEAPVVDPTPAKDGPATVKDESIAPPSSKPPISCQPPAIEGIATVAKESIAMQVAKPPGVTQPPVKAGTVAVKRERNSPPFPGTSVTKPTNITPNTPKTPRSNPQQRRRPAPAQLGPANAPQLPRTSLGRRRQLAREHVKSAQHQDILAQFRPPFNHRATGAGRIGDDWDEIMLSGQNRLVGWQ